MSCKHTHNITLTTLGTPGASKATHMVLNERLTENIFEYKLEFVQSG